MSGTRRFHRLLGLVLLLPILGWAATGLVFFTKPGYAQAYAGIQIRLVDRILGVVRLACRVALAVLGVRLAFGWNRPASPADGSNSAGAIPR